MTVPDKNLPLFPGPAITGLNDLLYYESALLERGYKRPAGVDEAGRGPLAGPVVAAAVIMPAGVTIPGVKDSKKMTDRAREVAFSVITETAAAIGVGVVSHKIIDKSNILVSSLEAMKLAVLAIDPAPEFLLVDGINKIPVLIPQKCIIKGDQLCHSISAASIIAKVYRDRIMRSYDAMYPEYGFFRNKGYGTAEHLTAIREKGACPIHRSTFRGVR